MNLDKKVLDQIERENIRIRPRWFWVLQSDLNWGLAFALEIASALFLGMAVFFAIEDQNLRAGTLLLGIFGVLFYFGFRRFFAAGFLQFYKLGFAAVLLVLFGANGALGYFWWGSGQAEKLENQIRETPAYQKMEPALDKVFDPTDSHKKAEENLEIESKKEEENEEEIKKEIENDSSVNEREEDSRDEKKEGRSSEDQEDKKDERLNKEEDKENEGAFRVKGVQTENKSRRDDPENDGEKENDSESRRREYDEAEKNSSSSNEEED
jgi:hypothetical protein